MTPAQEFMKYGWHEQDFSSENILPMRAVQLFARHSRRKERVMNDMSCRALFYFAIEHSPY